MAFKLFKTLAKWEINFCYQREKPHIKTEVYMEFLKDILGDLYESFESKVSEYNKANPDKPVKLANLSEGGYVSKQKYADLELEAKGYKEKIKGLEGKPEITEDLTELKNTIKTLQGENKTLKQDYEGKIAEIRKNSAIDAALLKARAIDPDMAKVKLDMNAIEMDESGNITGLSEQVEGLKKEYGFLFGDKAAYKPTNGNPPETVADLRGAVAEKYSANN